MVLPASGWEMIANVRRLAISRSSSAAETTSLPPSTPCACITTEEAATGADHDLRGGHACSLHKDGSEGVCRNAVAWLSGESMTNQQRSSTPQARMQKDERACDDARVSGGKFISGAGGQGSWTTSNSSNDTNRPGMKGVSRLTKQEKTPWRGSLNQ